MLAADAIARGTIINAILYSQLMICGEGPAIVFDNRPEWGLPPEAVAQSQTSRRNPPWKFQGRSMR